MLRSQLAAAQTWHLGDWNAFWEKKTASLIALPL